MKNDWEKYWSLHGDINRDNNLYNSDLYKVLYPHIERLDSIYQFVTNTTSWVTLSRKSHSHFVSYIANTIAKKMWCDDKIQEFACISGMIHDVWHPPFWHRGEQAINEVGKKYWYVFNHDIFGAELVDTALKEWDIDISVRKVIGESLLWRKKDVVLSDSSSINDWYDKTLPIDTIVLPIVLWSDRIAINVGDLIDGVFVWRILLDELTNKLPTFIGILKKNIARWHEKYISQLPYTKEEFEDIIFKNTDVQSFFLKDRKKDLTQFLIDDFVSYSKQHDTVMCSPSVQAEMKSFLTLCRDDYFNSSYWYQIVTKELLTLAMDWDITFGDWTYNSHLSEEDNFQLLVSEFTKKTDEGIIHICKSNIDAYPWLFEQLPSRESPLKINMYSDKDIIKKVQEKYKNQSYINDHTPFWHPLLMLDAIDSTCPQWIKVKKLPDTKVVIPIPKVWNSIQMPENFHTLNWEYHRLGDPVSSKNQIASGVWYTWTNGPTWQMVVGRPWVDAVIINFWGDKSLQNQFLKKFPDIYNENTITKETFTQIQSYLQSNGIESYPSTKKYIQQMYINDSWAIYGKNSKKESDYFARFVPGYCEVWTSTWTNQYFEDWVVVVNDADKNAYAINPDQFCSLYKLDNWDALNPSMLHDLPRVHLDSCFLETKNIPSWEWIKHISIIWTWMSGIMTLTNIIEKYKNIWKSNPMLISLYDWTYDIWWATYNRFGATAVGMANQVNVLWLDTPWWIVTYLNKDPVFWMREVPTLLYSPQHWFDKNQIISHNDYWKIVKKYIEDLLRSIESNWLPIKVQFIRARIENATWESLLIKSGKKQVSVNSDAVFVCTGNNLPNHLSDMHGETLAWVSWYYSLDDQALSKNNLKNLSKDDIIGIIWTWNGSLFSVLWAIWNWFEGKFFLISKTWKVPTKEGKVSELFYERSLLTYDSIIELSKSNTFSKATLLQLWKSELSTALDKWFGWRSVIDSLIPEINSIWNALCDQDRQIFIEELWSIRNNVRYRIPNDHRTKISELISEWRVVISWGYSWINVIRSAEWNIFDIIYETKEWVLTQSVSMIVNNTWPSKSTQNKLVASMAEARVVALDDWIISSTENVYSIWPVISNKIKPENITIPAIRSMVWSVVDEFFDKTLWAKNESNRQSYWFHYSWFDHRPYDYTQQSPEELWKYFVNSRYWKSLTHCTIVNYTQEQKELFFSIEYAKEVVDSGLVKAPKNKTVLWSWWWIPWHPLWYWLWRVMAEHFLVTENTSYEDGSAYETICDNLYHTVAMTQWALPVLNPMWDDSEIPYSLKSEITPHYILAFVRNAEWNVAVSVDDTDCDSFFRTHELIELMENNKVTWITKICYDEKWVMDTIKYNNKSDWYQDQRDQWVSSIKARYNYAKKFGSESDIARMHNALQKEKELSKNILNSGRDPWILSDFNFEREKKRDKSLSLITF